FIKLRVGALYCQLSVQNIRLLGQAVLGYYGNPQPFTQLAKVALKHASADDDGRIFVARRVKVGRQFQKIGKKGLVQGFEESCDVRDYEGRRLRPPAIDPILT